MTAFTLAALSLILAQQPDAPPQQVIEATTAPSSERLTWPVAIRPVPWYERLSIGGFARLQAGYTFPLRDEQLVGGQGGFRVADFRLNLDFRPIDKLTVFTSIELAAPLITPDDPLTGRRVVELRDAYVQYDVCRGFMVRAGQFRPSYNVEMLVADGAVAFISRSVLANGFNPPDAYGPRQPLSPDRQIGLQVGSKRFGSTVGFKYAAGVFNGSGQNQLFNDNNIVMPVARIEVDVMEKISLGLNASYNVRAEGVRPNRLATNEVSYGADLEAHHTIDSKHALSAMAVFLARSSTFSFDGLPAELAMGVMGQVRYLHDPSGFEAAVRVAYFEPSSAQNNDQVTETAAMVGWRPFHLPFRVLGQYTHRGEESRVGYANDSVDLMLHAVW